MAVLVATWPPMSPQDMLRSLGIKGQAVLVARSPEHTHCSLAQTSLVSPSVQKEDLTLLKP